MAFAVGPDDRLDLEQTYPKERYRDLAHFQGVMGKFEPYIFFLRKPVEVEAVSFKALKELAQGATGKPLS